MNVGMVSSRSGEEQVRDDQSSKTMTPRHVEDNLWSPEIEIVEVVIVRDTKNQQRPEGGNSVFGRQRALENHNVLGFCFSTLLIFYPLQFIDRSELAVFFLIIYLKNILFT